MRILVTRLEPDATALVDLLAQAGHVGIAEPLMQVQFDTDAALDLQDVQGVLLTSANGARALARATDRRDLALYCVGAASARQAKSDGFNNLHSADGDVTALAALVQASCDPSMGPLVHVAGSVVAGDLAGQLDAAGFTARRAVLYDARPVTRLSPGTATALAAGDVDAVMLFSPRTAKCFASLVADAQLKGACGGIDLICLSQAVADAVADLPHRKILVADRPITDAMLALL